jgi:hypothetical protein
MLFNSYVKEAILLFAFAFINRVAPIDPRDKALMDAVREHKYDPYCVLNLT